MLELFTYVDNHPWWTLLYLIVICSSFSGLINVTLLRNNNNK